MSGINNVNKIGIVRTLDPIMYNCLLLTARKNRLSKARSDLSKLKAQRNHKRDKEELLLQMNLEKASEKFIDVMFYYNKYIEGKCWMSVEDVEHGLSNIKGIVAQRDTLKDMITIYVKGLQWNQYHTKWSHNRKQFSVEYLKEHLIYIISDSAAKGLEVTKPVIDAPARKALPVLGEMTVDIRMKIDEDAQQLSMLEDKSSNIRLALISAGKRDEMKLLQPKSAPSLEVNMMIQYAFRYADDDTSDEHMEWCTGKITRIGNGSNMRNNSGFGPKFYRKGGAAEIEWVADESKNEDVSYAIVKIDKKDFNTYVEHGWRLHFDVPWSNVPLQERICESSKEDDCNCSSSESVNELLDQRKHLLGKCRVLWDELQRRDAEEDYDNLVDVNGHDSAVVEEEE